MSSEKDQKPFLIDAKAVKTLARILNETDLSEIEYELESGRIKVVRTRTVYGSSPVESSMGTSAVLPVSSPASSVEAPAAFEKDFSQHPGALKSPLVGTAYLSGQPGAAPFVKEGDTVQEGQTLLILEAMKVMNPIRSSKSGKILKILVQNSQPVEFGEVLLVIE